MEEIIKLEGTIAHITFQSEQTGFTVMELETDEEIVTVVGEMAGVGEGQKLVAFGEYVNHPSFGTQFKVQSYEISLPSDVNAIFSYLLSGAIKGIGTVTAKKIVDKFGEETFKILDTDPDKLCTIQGMSLKKALAIQQEFKKIYGIQDAIAYLSAQGILAKDAIALYSYYGAKTIEIVSSNPFVLCADPCFFEFSRADEISEKFAMEYDSCERIVGGIMYVLRHNTLKGHSCVPLKRLLETVSTFIAVELEKVEKNIEELCEQGLLVQEEMEEATFVFLAELYVAEKIIAEKLAELLMVEVVPSPRLESLIADIETVNDIRYASKQLEAIAKVCASNVSIITGGPGTGKTTLVKAIISLFEMQGDKISLCAPTGRAAKRLAELSGRTAKTIHRLLEVVPGSRDFIHFARNRENPLPCEVLIVDEFSMVDVVLFSQLIIAIKENCKVILVGDYNQLPAVGPGNILKDLLGSGRIPSVQLVDIFRQAQQSMIVVNAHNINSGIAPKTSDKNGDFFVMECEPAKAEQLVTQLVAIRLPKAYGYDSNEDIQVLCPSKKKSGGTISLNVSLQKALNPEANNKNQINFNGVIFRECDKIMQIRNNYDLAYEKDDGTNDIGVFNGDIGYIERVDKQAKIMDVRFEDRVYAYTQEEFIQLEHAYAITVHKSQGCEFKAVVLCISDTAKELQYRNLLYTAITRAKNLLVIVGKAEILKTMAQNHRKQLRYSGIKHFLEEFYE